MANYLKTLSQISEPNLTVYDFDGMTEEIINLIKSDSNWNSIRDGELEQNASLMILEFFTFLFKKNSEYFNRLIRENFITLAKDPNSILSILSSSNSPVNQNTASYVRVKGSLNNDFLPSELILDAGYQLSAKDFNGNDTTIELYNRDLNDSSKIDYFSPIIIPQYESEFYIEGFSGTTFMYEVILTTDTKKNFTIEVPFTNVIDNSIRIFYDINNVNKELVKTTTFSKSKNPIFIPDFPNGIPYFKESFDSNGKPTILFGNENFGGNFAIPAGKIIRIYGRTGGGSLTNINKFSLNTSRVFNFAGNKQVTVLFQNPEKGSGGSDRENIEELRTFGPLRTARENKITDNQDALLALNSKVQKHKVVSPVESNIDNTIQVFHYENYIAPKRQFNDFIFPTVLETDTIETYNTKFIKELNDYLNLSGIRDSKITDEFITNFTNVSNLTYNLKQSPPLNGSIVLKAYDSNGIIVDQLSFKQNYLSEKINFPSLITSKAEVSSSFVLTNSITVSSSNNKLKLIIDELPIGSGLEEEITISSALYGLDSEGNHSDLANNINTQIKNIPFYSIYVNHVFCIAKNNKIYLISPTNGEYSMIRIVNTVNSIHSLVALPLVENYAYPESGRVFLSNLSDFTTSSYYSHGSETDLQYAKILASYSKNSTNLIILNKLNSTNIIPGMLVYGTGIPLNTIVLTVVNDLVTLSSNPIENIFNALVVFKYPKFSITPRFNLNRFTKEVSSSQLGLWPNANLVTGPSKTISLIDYNFNKFKIQSGSLIKVEAFDGITKIGEINFSNVTANVVNPAIEVSGGLFDLTKTNFDFTTSSIFLKMLDADGLQLPPYGYNPVQGINYTSSTYFKISFQIDTFSYITIDYLPNPYFLTDEAKGLQMDLISPERRMMCFSPIFKRVEFIPTKLSLSILKQQFKSASELYKQVFDFIQSNFSYFSTDFDFNIGKGFSLDYIRNSIVKTGDITGIATISFNIPNSNIVDEIGNKFYFILSEDFINRIKLLEEEYINLKDFSRLYSLDIIINQI